MKQTKTQQTAAAAASMTRVSAAGTEDGPAEEEAVFAAFREQAEAMICWARGGEAAGIEHGPLEEQALARGMELTRLLVQAHLDLRAIREQRRDDVTDADGDRRVTCEDGQEHTRIMVFGTVVTSRIAYRKREKENLYPQDADLSWAGDHAYSNGITSRVAKAAAVIGFGPAAAQVSAGCAVTIGKRQCEELATGAAADFEAFYAARRPGPAPDAGLLITGDGSALPVLPGALREATARAAAARAEAAARSGWPDDPAACGNRKNAVPSLPPSPTSPSRPAPPRTSSPPSSAPPAPATATATATATGRVPPSAGTGRKQKARPCSRRSASRSPR